MERFVPSNGASAVSAILHPVRTSTLPGASMSRRPVPIRWPLVIKLKPCVKW